MKKKLFNAENAYLNQKNKEMLMGSRIEVNFNFILQNINENIIFKLENLNQKEKLIKTGEMLSNQNDKLRQAKINALEIENTAINVQEKLFENREVMNRALNKVIFYLLLILKYIFIKSEIE